MQNGIWVDADIKFAGQGTKSAPVVLKPETVGGVLFTGNSTLTFTGQYLIAQSLFFTRGYILKGSVVTFNSNHCSLNDSKIINFNPPDFDDQYFWVLFKGSFNIVNHCLFEGKSNAGPLICNSENDSRYNTITYCNFENIPLKKHNNGREIIKVVGYGHSDQTGDDGAYMTIANNLFENADGEGVEIISLKSNHNLVLNNTVRTSCGALVNRRGNFNRFEGNYIFGGNKAGTLGIRIANENNTVVNNYISGVEGSGLLLMAAEYIDSPLTAGYNATPRLKSGKMVREPAYGAVKHCTFENNIIANASGYGIDIGYAYKKDWSSKQIVLLPEENIFRHNLILNSSREAIHVVKADMRYPLNKFSFKKNLFEGNIIRQIDNSAMDDCISTFNRYFKGRHPISKREVGPQWK